MELQLQWRTNKKS